MAKQNTVKPQEGSSDGRMLMRLPPIGTVARNRSYYPYINNPQLASRKLKNPLSGTDEIVAQGKVYYERYCVYCHGISGDSIKGAAVALKMSPPRSKSLLSEKAVAYSDGFLYHIIYNGQGFMGGYSLQLDTKQQTSLVHYMETGGSYKGSSRIWMIVHYVRMLQKKSALQSKAKEK